VNGGARAQEEAGTDRQAPGHNGQVPRGDGRGRARRDVPPFAHSPQ